MEVANPTRNQSFLLTAAHSVARLPSQQFHFREKMLREKTSYFEADHTSTNLWNNLDPQKNRNDDPAKPVRNRGYTKSSLTERWIFPSSMDLTKTINLPTPTYDHTWMSTEVIVTS